MARFFLGDGSFSDEPPLDGRNVQAIVKYTDHDGWHMVTGYDYYINVNGDWIGVSIDGLIDYMLLQGHALMGRMLSNGDYSRIIKEAGEYRDKQPWQPHLQLKNIIEEETMMDQNPEQPGKPQQQIKTGLKIQDKSLE